MVNKLFITKTSKIDARCNASGVNIDISNCLSLLMLYDTLQARNSCLQSIKDLPCINCQFLKFWYYLQRGLPSIHYWSSQTFAHLR